MTEPLVPLINPRPGVRLLTEWAAMQLPELQRPGIRLVAQITEAQGSQLAAIIQWRDVSGGILFTRSVTGERSATGVIDWRF